MTRQKLKINCNWTSVFCWAHLQWAWHSCHNGCSVSVR